VESAATVNLDPLIKIYSPKNRLTSFLVLTLALFLLYVLSSEILHIQNFAEPVGLSSRHAGLSQPVSLEIVLLAVGILAALMILRVSLFPSVIMTDKEIRIGFRFCRIFGMTYQHVIPWNRISHIDSGGAKMIQWSNRTSIIYHTGSIPVGRSSDLREVEISTGLGMRNYCRIISQAIDKSPHASIDPLTLTLVNKCTRRTTHPAH